MQFVYITTNHKFAPRAYQSVQQLTPSVLLWRVALFTGYTSMDCALFQCNTNTLNRDNVVYINLN